MHLWPVAGNIHRESWKSKRCCWPPEHIHGIHPNSDDAHDSFWCHERNLKRRWVRWVWFEGVWNLTCSPGWIMCGYAAGSKSGNASSSHGNPSCLQAEKELYKVCIVLFQPPIRSWTVARWDEGPKLPTKKKLRITGVTGSDLISMLIPVHQMSQWRSWQQFVFDPSSVPN